MGLPGRLLLLHTLKFICGECVLKTQPNKMQPNIVKIENLHVLNKLSGQYITLQEQNDLAKSIYFHELLEENELKIIMVPKNLDCLYHIISKNSPQAEYSVIEFLRLQVAIQIQLELEFNITCNANNYRKMIESKRFTAEEYIENIINAKMPADNLQIIVLMIILQRPIYIIGFNNTIINMIDINELGKLINFDQPILVYYNGMNHYDGLVLQNDATQSIESLILDLTERTNYFISQNYISYNYAQQAYIESNSNISSSSSKRTNISNIVLFSSITKPKHHPSDDLADNKTKEETRNNL